MTPPHCHERAWRDVGGKLEREKEPEPVISLDGSPRAHAGVCRLSNNRRTRWSEAAVARPRIISRSPGSSVRTRLLAVRADGVHEDETDGLVGRSSARAGDARDRDADVCAEPRPHAVRPSRGAVSAETAPCAVESLDGDAELGLP